MAEELQSKLAEASQKLSTLEAEKRQLQSQLQLQEEAQKKHSEGKYNFDRDATFTNF